MFLTSRYRRMLDRRDAGAVAIVVALVSLVLFGIAALAIDIGEMYSRRRAAQTDADFAALAGAAALPNQAAAFDLAYDYLEKNLPPGGPLPEEAVFSDGIITNGEILFPSAYKIRVVAPPRNVQFGFAGAIGFSDADVSAAATVEIRSPAAAVPFFLTLGAQSGYSCLKDTSPGGSSGSAVRAALLAPAPKPPSINDTSPDTLSTLGGETLVVTGNNFKDGPTSVVTSVQIDGVEATAWTVDSKTQLSVIGTPAHVPGSATLTITAPDGTASAVLTYTVPPAIPAPTVTDVTPASGPLAGGNTVTITGTGFSTATGVTFGVLPATSPTITSDTEIQATVPAATTADAVHVHVTNPGGTSAESDADLYTYEVDVCAGTTGNFGYLDIPRSAEPAPPGVNDRIVVNTIKGIDHSWETYPHVIDPGEECKHGTTLIADAVLDDGDGVDGANCLKVETGNKVVNVGEAFLDGYNAPGSGEDLDPKLLAPSGHGSVTLHGRTGMDRDRMSDYLSVSLTEFVAKLAASPDPVDSEVEGWVKADILNCPRFAIVPVLNAVENPPSGYYPITGFAGVFIDGEPTDYGFEPSNDTASQMKAIRAYAFSLDYLPGIISSGATAGTVTFLGSGPKVPVLVHDEADPSY